MKKIYTALSILALSAAASAQVGINTTVAPDDVAKVVIASPTPGNGTLIFETPASPAAVGQVLVSDADGNATWTTLDIHPETIYNGVGVNYAVTGVSILHPANSPQDTNAIKTGATFTVPEGLWQIYISLKINAEVSQDNQLTWRKLKAGESMWVRMVIGTDANDTSFLYSTYKNNDYLYDNDPSTWDPPALVSGNVVGPNSNGLLKGEIFIRNCNGSSGRPSSTPTTVRTDPFYLKGVVSIFNNTNLYYRVINLGAAPSVNGENRIVPVYMGKCPQ